MNAYYLAAIDPNDKVKPGFQGDLEVFVAQDLEAKSAFEGWRRTRSWGFGVQARDEAVQCTKDAHNAKRLAAQVSRTGRAAHCDATSCTEYYIQLRLSPLVTTAPWVAVEPRRDATLSALSAYFR